MLVDDAAVEFDAPSDPIAPVAPEKLEVGELLRAAPIVSASSDGFVGCWCTFTSASAAV